MLVTVLVTVANVKMTRRVRQVIFVKYLDDSYLQSGRPDSNRRRPAWEAGILPTELRPRRRVGNLVNDCPLFESHRSGLNRRPPDYESGALPLSYCGKGAKSPSLPSALERTRTAMPFGTTPSRWRVYQFHHQGRT